MNGFVKLTRKIGNTITSTFTPDVYVVIVVRSHESELWDTPLPLEKGVSVHFDLDGALQYMRTVCDELKKARFDGDDVDTLLDRAGQLRASRSTLTYVSWTQGSVDLMLVRKPIQN